MNADGGGRRRLTSSTGEDYPGWSPDGRKIAFVRDGGVYVVNADGSQERRLTRIGAFLGLAWSPDGRRIAFASRTDRAPFGASNSSVV